MSQILLECVTNVFLIECILLLGTCVRRLEADVSDPNGQLATSISAVAFKGPPAMEARILKKTKFFVVALNNMLINMCWSTDF